MLSRVTFRNIGHSVRGELAITNSLNGFFDPIADYLTSGKRDRIFTEPARYWEPFPEAGSRLSAWGQPEDLIIVHSIPSGVLGVARYMQSSHADHFVGSSIEGMAHPG